MDNQTSKYNIAEIARLAGVSTATVSRVINNSDRVRPETREKVQNIIKEYDYIPSETARGLSTKRNRMIGYVIPDLNNPFFFNIFKGISDRAEKEGFSIPVFDTREDPEREKVILQNVISRDLSGLIITPVESGLNSGGSTNAILEKCEARGIPVVLVDRQIHHGEYACVRADDEGGAYSAVKALIDAGHTKIAVISGNIKYSPTADRLKGYMSAMNDAGIPVRDEYVCMGDQMLDKSYVVMNQLLDLEDPPTAVFTCNNMMTLGALKALTERHLRIDRDMSIVSFDDIQALRVIDFRLSTVDRSEKDMGVMAMELLLRQMTEGHKISDVIRVPTKLTLRGSEKKFK